MDLTEIEVEFDDCRLHGVVRDMEHDLDNLRAGDGEGEMLRCNSREVTLTLVEGTIIRDGVAEDVEPGRYLLNGHGLFKKVD